MATPALGGALKPLLTGDVEAETKYQDALDRITAALDAREKRSFDPTLMALAQGLLAPTKTGSFGESIGQAAGAVIPVQQQQEKEAMENAQMRLQLAQAQREMAMKKEGLEFLSGGAQPPSGVQFTKGDGTGVGVMINGREITPRIISILKISKPEVGKALEDEYKLALESVVVQQGGIANKITGQYTPFGGKPMVERTVPDVGIVKMPEQDAMELDNARREGDAAKYWAIVDRNTKPMGKPGAAPATGAAPVAGAPAGAERTTQASLEAQAAAEKKRAEKTAESEVERTQAAINAAADADSRLNSATVVKSLMDQEGMPQVVGVLEKPGMLPGLLKAAEEGVNAGRGFGLSLPQVRQIYTQNKITLPPVKGESAEQYRAREEAVISRLQQLSSEFARITFGFRSMAKGQGAISNLENNIFQSMGPTIQDTYQTIMAKTAHSAARAEADKKIAEALTDSGMSVDRFKKTDQYKQIQRDYDNQLRSIYGGVQAGGRPVIGKTTAGPVTAEDLRSRLPK